MTSNSQVNEYLLLIKVFTYMMRNIFVERPRYGHKIVVTSVTSIDATFETTFFENHKINAHVFFGLM